MAAAGRALVRWLVVAVLVLSLLTWLVLACLAAWLVLGVVALDRRR